MHEGSESRMLLDSVRILFTTGTAVGLTDRDLLNRFLHEGREPGESAFRTLVERHGPMVFRVCNQALKDRHAAEDAFQATFLVLARRARSIRNHDSLGSWLFGVASRAAARIRMMEARRRRYERRGAGVRHGEDSAALDPSEHWPELHSEIARLPEKYRIPIVLCYFEGLTHEQAAARLGWPVGTVKTRLNRARDRLRRRLEGRGGTSAIAIPAGSIRPSELVDVPRHLTDSTVWAAVRFVSAGGTMEITSSSILTITQGVLKAMLINRLRLAAIVLLGVMALGLGAMVLARQSSPERRADIEPRPASTSTKEDPPSAVLRLFATTDYVPTAVTVVRTRFDCRVDEVLVDLGATVKPGDPLLKLFSTDLAAAKNEYAMACSQWRHDKALYDYKRPLAKNKTLPARELIDVENTEAQSRLKMEIAKDKLLGYGLSENEVRDALNLDEDAVRRRTMILRSPGEGVLVKKSVVKGNYYGIKDELMVIATLDRLEVRGTIDADDLDKVHVGQPVNVVVPFSTQPEIVARIEYVDGMIDAATRTAKFRTTISNPDGRIKAGAFVRVDVDLGLQAKTSRARNVPAEPKSPPTLEQRLSEVERKLERLLGEKTDRASNARMLDRLNELERKLDRVLELRDR